MLTNLILQYGNIFFFSHFFSDLIILTLIIFTENYTLSLKRFLVLTLVQKGVEKTKNKILILELISLSSKSNYLHSLEYLPNFIRDIITNFWGMLVKSYSKSIWKQIFVIINLLYFMQRCLKMLIVRLVSEQELSNF